MKVEKKDKISDVKKSTRPRRDDEGLFWVGIGAAAGGLEALRAFVANIPEPQGQTTYIVAQHLSPNHHTALVKLLSEEATLPVREIQNGMHPHGNTIYVTPPNKDVYVQEGTLYLRSPISPLAARPSVDCFFSTLAETQKEHAIGVILSGIGTDGVHGVRAIRAAGGITIAQNPKTAKFEGMPKNAIQTGCIDVVLPPEQMPKQISFITESPRHLSVFQEDVERIDIQRLLFKLEDRCGVDFKKYELGMIYRRINRRMSACLSPDITKYLEYVSEHPSELEVLYNDFLISVTNFFRDPEAFDRLRDAIDDIIKTKQVGDPIRVWVPGCASGEEAYSIVILFAECAGGLDKLSEYRFQLFATDVDNKVLSKARKGVYVEATLANVSSDIREAYFQTRDQGYEIRKRVRDFVVFSKHNILENPSFLRLDLISCRNLLIYFNTKVQEKLMKLFHTSLQPNGFLFLGKSENLGQSADLFHVIDNKARLYRQKLVPNEGRNHFHNVIYYPTQKNYFPIAPTRGKAMHELSDAMARALSPNSLLINDKMDVIRIYGDVSPFTELSPGIASMNLLSLIKKDFRQELRALAYKVLREQKQEAVLLKMVKVAQDKVDVHIVVRRLFIRSAEEAYLLISFDQKVRRQLIPVSKEHGPDYKPIIHELENELKAVRNNLQTVVEELETSNEELLHTNQEMQISNEELLSANEELETANEELQSANEELLSVNEELQIKTKELSVSIQDLTNIKDSLEFPTLVVTKNLKIKLYNEAAKLIFRLENEQGINSISSINTLIDLPDFKDNILGVIKTGHPYTRQIDTNEVCYLESILPYRNEAGETEGAVLIYVNNTESRQALQNLQDSEARYQLTTSGASVGLWDWDIQADVLTCSSLALNILNVTDKSFEPKFAFFETRIHPDDRDDVLAILKAHLENGFDFNIECRMALGCLKESSKKEAVSYIWVHLCGHAEWNNRKKAVRMSGSLANISLRRQYASQLRDAKEALNRFLLVCSYDLKEPSRVAENFATILLEQYASNLDEDGQKCAKYIVESTRKMQTMIRDMLSYSQVDTQGLAFEKIKCNDLVKHVVDSLRTTIQERNAQVIYENLPEILGDKVQVFQLFQNLISNGIKFCKAKKPKIQITAHDHEGYWCFTVRDNGIGIKKEYQRIVFEAFKTLNKSTDYPGTGIGLSICQKIVSRHGGKIWVESSPQKGSQFFFTIPKVHSASISPVAA